MKKTIILIAVVLFSTFAVFISCENTIMETWWVDRDDSQSNSPDKEFIFQNISVITIEYVLFAGNQPEFNNPQAIDGASNLSTAQMESNQRVLDMAATMLREKPEYLVLLHGHANPVDGSPGELDELKQISTDRAISTSVALRTTFIGNGAFSADDINSRMRATGYGGGLTKGDSLHADVNRRVEVIIFTITVDEN
ncbi:MAG: hypothetical protein FWD91_00135 [Treponema sp.]|nr:hypothetical protein [Treponema sp.]